MRASIGKFFERRLPLPFETGIIINIDLVPYFGNALKVMLDGQELLKYDSVVNPSLARKVAFWFGTSADYAMIRRIEVTKNP
ncbi:hypothetical protein DPMN_134196 [Dreissena polymorpha]|uniref:Uncharacterized protein n=1 Tax=Dreissena polymorpha TaxID=45954 RepID=A0A9D4FZB3_DREPO|nr:hypothetical protein DPMN_134196 [Dreissena polymorpha]